MKALLVSFIVSISLFSAPTFTVAAESDRFVVDVIWVSMRSGPGTGFKVLKTGLRSGTKMKVIGESEDKVWLNVALQDGKNTEGWIPKRYLTNKLIAKDQLKVVEKELSGLKASLAKTSTSLQSLKSESASASQSLSSIQKERDSLKKELARIKEISANALTLDMRNGELLQENQELKNNLDVLKVENQYLDESNVSQEWLVGGLIAFFGLLAGFLLSRSGGKRGGARQDSWA